MAEMVSFTHHRLEPIPTTPDDLTSGLAAPLADPLWLLHRQRQVGEFAASDGGYPIIAELGGSTAQLTDFYSSGQTAGIGFDALNDCLESRAEAEAVFVQYQTSGTEPFPPGMGRAAVEAGLQFARFARKSQAAAEVNAQLSAFPLEDHHFDDLSSDTRRLRTLAVGRVANGYKLYQHLKVQTSKSTAEQQFVDWCDGFFEEPADGATSTWVDRRQEHHFSTKASLSINDSGNKEVALTAGEYHGGRLDWYHFDAEVTSGGTPASKPVSWQALPTPARYAGMPAERYWEFEDEKVRFGDIQNGVGLATSLLIDFGISYSHDWFVIPLDLTVGSVTNIDSLVVTDSFGITTRIKPTVVNDRVSQDSDGGPLPWTMFSWGVESADSDGYFLLAPTLASSQHSVPIERVSLVRDEAANVAFAIEQTVLSAATTPHDLRIDHESLVEQGASAGHAGSSSTARLTYRLQTYLPEHWHPLTPGLQAGERVLELQNVHRPQGISEPRGEVLRSSNGNRFTINFEEVPRGGAEVVRDFQLTRWTDGSYRLWAGRRKRPGRVETSSGLRYDSIEYSENSQTAPPVTATPTDAGLTPNRDPRKRLAQVELSDAVQMQPASIDVSLADPINRPTRKKLEGPQHEQ